MIIIALSGTVSQGFSKGYTLSTNWSASQNISGNYSVVTCNHYLICANTYALYINSKSNSCIVGGVSQAFTSSAISTGGGTTIWLGATTHTINHNADGTASVSLSTTFNIKATLNGSYVASVTASGTITLDTIPRASSVTCNSFYIGDSTTININRASSAFTHTITYVYGYLSGTIAEKTSLTSIGWTPPAAEFYGQIPNGTTGYGSVTCQTYNGNTLIGTTTADFNAYAKQNDCLATVSATIVDTNSATIAVTGNSAVLVKGLSKPKVTVTATPKNSASIKSYRIAWGDGSTSTNAEHTFSGGVTNYMLTVTATDSRNYASAITYDINHAGRWVDYTKLSIKSANITRTESTSNICTLSLNGDYYNAYIATTQNTLTAKLRFKETGGTYTDWIPFSPTIVGNTYSSEITLTDIDYQKQHEFEVQVEDKLMVVNSGTIIVSKGVGVWRIGNGYVKTFGDFYDKFHTKIPNGLAVYNYGAIDPDTTLESLVLTEKNTPNKNGFYYITTMFYYEKSVTARRTQIAYPYIYDVNQDKKDIFVRQYVDGAWNEWSIPGEEDVTNKFTFNGTYTGKVYKKGKVVHMQIYLYPAETAGWGVLATVPKELYPYEIYDYGTTISGTACWIYGKNSTVAAGQIKGTSTVGTPITLCGTYITE